MAQNVNADAFIQSIWDASVIRTLEDETFLKKIARTRPAKAPKGYGDTVFFNGLADPTIGDYAGSISYETLVSDQVALLINKQPYYAFKVTDIEAVMANVDLKGSQADRAAYMLQKSIDTYAFGSATAPLVADAGNVMTADTTADTATILEDISNFARILEENNVRSGNMWILIPPWVKQKLILAGVEFQINNGMTGKGGMEFANYLGIDLYVTNNLYNSGTAAAPVTTIVGGSYDAVVYADVPMPSRAMQLESGFEVGLSGMLNYGVKVVKPKELVTQILTWVVES